MSRKQAGLVTVVIPAYNASRWIAGTLSSIARQDHSPVEVIVVDNGSTDDTVARVHSAMPEARVLRATVRGPSAAKNVGLDAARGEFVQFLDADDLIAPGKLARHVDTARESAADVVWGGYVRTPTPEQPFDAGSVVVPRLASDDLLRSFIDGHGFLPLAAALFANRGPLQATRFDESRLVVEDVQWLIRLRSAGATFVQADDVAGLIVREHDSPARASRIGDSAFYRACADNAALVLDEWTRQGETMTPARADTLLEVWLAAAERLSVVGDEYAETVVRRAASVDARYLRRVRLPHRPLARALGFSRAVRLVERIRRLRNRVAAPVRA